MATFKQALHEIKHALMQHYPHPGFQYEGIATYLIGIQHFYVVPMSIYNLMSVFEKPGEPYDRVPAIYEVLIYKSPALGQFARGRVTKVFPNGSYSIFAVDYGVTDEEVTSANIFKALNAEALTLPAFAQCCELAQCYPRHAEFSPENTKCFKFFMGADRERMIVIVKAVKPHKLTVLVKTSRSNPDDVSLILGYTNNSLLYPPQLMHVQLIPDITGKIYRTGVFEINNYRHL